MARAKSKLAILGGPKAVTLPAGDAFIWPIVTKKHEKAILEVLHGRKMSGTDITMQFEQEYAAWQGTKFALAHNTGTAAIQSAMFGCEVGSGDEIIGPSMTFWASLLQALSLRASVVFADIEPSSLCIDPKDIEHRITPRTKAIVAVHYAGHPADMDPIMRIARKHKIKVIEDVSHAHGALYKGRKVGTIGHVGAMSLMTGKSFAIGEGGILCTNDRKIYERAVAFGHYERTGRATQWSQTKGAITRKELRQYGGVPLGGFKYRMMQFASALGRVQLKVYDKQMAEIQKAMNYFWDLLEGVPGIRAHRPAKDSGSTMGGWYSARGLYVQEELGGLPVEKFCEAVAAEGVPTSPGANFPLNTHDVFHTADIYHEGRPTNTAHTRRKLNQGPGTMPVSEAIFKFVYGIQWFRRYRPRLIRQHANAFRKVAEHAAELL